MDIWGISANLANNNVANEDRKWEEGTSNEGKSSAESTDLSMVKRIAERLEQFLVGVSVTEQQLLITVKVMLSTL